MPSRMAASGEDKTEQMDVDPGGLAVTEPMAVDQLVPIARSESEFQKVNKLAKYMPYSDHLSSTREILWTNLQKHFCTALVSQGQPLQDWIYACEQYLVAFGFAFSKQDHIFLIKMCWQALFSIEHDYTVLRKLAKLLSRLLSNTKLISRSELQLDWRQLYNLLEVTQYSSHARKQTILFEPEFISELKELTFFARPYFSTLATAEMLSEWKQYMCIYSNKFRKYISLFRSFLPTLLPPEEHQHGFKLWFEQFMNLWIALPNQELDQYGCFTQLFSSLARNAIGYIDWEPYMPLLFQRFKKSFNGLIMVSNEVNMSAQWIVYMIYPGSSCLAKLKQLYKFRLVESRSMLSCIMDEFIKRIRVERHQKNKHWFDWTPDSHKLTDEIITEFGQFMFKQFKKQSFTEFDVDYLYKLSLFCSELLPQEVVDKLSLAHERFYEPNRLQPALQLFSISLYHMVTNEKIGPTHRSHAISIMTKLVHTINTNDHNLCYLHLFAIRSVVILGLPLQNVSHHVEEKKSELSKAQKKLLKNSVPLDEFAMEFLNCCFTIVESNNEDLFNFSKKGLGLKVMLFDIFVHVLANVSQEKYKELVNKLYKYVTSRISENSNSCFILHKLILACVMMDSNNYVLPKFFRGLTKNILEAIDDKEKYSDICKSEFVYYLALLSGCFSDGKSLLQFRLELLDLFKRMFAIDFQDNSVQISLVTNSISCLFNILTGVYPIEQSFNPRAFDKNKDKPDYLLEQFLNWPHEVELKDLPMKWYQPGAEAIGFAKELFREFIRPQMDLLENWANLKVDVAKAQLEKSLNIILSFAGFRDSLPKFSTEKSLYEELYFTDRDIFALDLFDGENFRENLVYLMQKVLVRLKDCPSENIPSLKLIIKILDYAIFPADAVNASNPTDFSLMDEFAAEDIITANDSSKNALIAIYQTIGKKKSYIPLVHYTRTAEYHLKMLSTLKCWTNAQLTDVHKLAIEQLLELSTCTCTEVRMEAQAILLDVLESWPKSFEIIVPILAGHLANHVANYDAFKGTLYMLLGTCTKSLLLSDQWQILNLLWPALVENGGNFVEKPKIVDLLDNELLPLFTGYYFTVPIEKSLVSAKFVPLFEGAFEKGFQLPSEEQIAKIEKSICDVNQSNQQLYHQLIDKMMTILNSHKLHWRFYNLGLSLLNFLIRYDRPFPVEASKVFLDNIVHDSVKIRFTASSGLKKILSLLKPLKQTEKIFIGDVKFDELPLDCLTDKATYESTVFYDKAHIGFYPNCEYTVNKTIPNPLMEKYQFIKEKFRDEAFLDKIFDLYSIEKEKNEQMDSLMDALEKISDLVPIDNASLGMISAVDDNLVKIWQYLFQSFSLFNAELIFPRIEKLIQENKPNHDKLAVEIMVGLVKASPTYNYEQMIMLKNFFLGLFDKHLEKFHTDSKNMWNYLFNSFFTNRDLRRFSWVEEYLFSDKLFTESMTMSCQSSYLNFLSNVLTDNWKYSKVSQKVLSRLEPNMSYKYQTVRLAIASIISKSIFFPRIGLGYYAGMKPDQSEFIDRIVAHLAQSLSNNLFVSSTHESADDMAAVKSDIFDNDSEEGKELHNYIETICQWIFTALIAKHMMNAEHFLKLLPYLCVMQTTNKSVQNNVNKVISTISVMQFVDKDIDNVFEHLVKISKNWNWHTRNEAAIFANNFIYTNIYVIRSNPKWIESYVGLIMTLLQDEKIEVRDSARKTLSNLIAWKVIDKQQRVELIGRFKEQMVNDSNGVTKHGASLGLCAFVFAFPRTFPKFLPDIVLFLCKYLTDPQPIQKTVNEALKSFMKTHQDNWVEHKQKFTTEQLNELADVSIFSSYIS